MAEPSDGTGTIRKLPASFNDESLAAPSPKKRFIRPFTPFFFDDHESGGLRFNDVVTFQLDSWRAYDYDRAVQSPLVHQTTIRNCLLTDWVLLSKTVDANEAVAGSNVDECVKEAVKLKYRYAGGSARFMIEYGYLELLSRLDGWMENCKRTDWDEFTSNAGPSEATINRLMQRFACGQRNNCTPVSEYVVRRAYEVCRSQLTTTVKAAANKTGNPLLLRWAFEMGEWDKFDQTREANLNSTAASSEWSAIEVEVCSPKTGANHKLVFCPLFLVKYDGNELTEKVKSCSVIQYDIWNHGCFNVAFLFGTTLVTIQVTTANSHSFQLKFVTDLRNARVTVNDVVHVSIVPDSNLEGFKLETNRCYTATKQCEPRTGVLHQGSRPSLFQLEARPFVTWMKQTLMVSLLVAWKDCRNKADMTNA